MYVHSLTMCMAAAMAFRKFSSKKEANFATAPFPSMYLIVCITTSHTKYRVSNSKFCNRNPFKLDICKIYLYTLKGTLSPNSNPNFNALLPS